MTNLDFVKDVIKNCSLDFDASINKHGEITITGFCTYDVCLNETEYFSEDNENILNGWCVSSIGWDNGTYDNPPDCELKEIGCCPNLGSALKAALLFLVETDIDEYLGVLGDVEMESQNAMA